VGVVIELGNAPSHPPDPLLAHANESRSLADLVALAACTTSPDYI
jgi:hypothetical protein